MTDREREREIETDRQSDREEEEEERKVLLGALSSVDIKNRQSFEKRNNFRSSANLLYSSHCDGSLKKEENAKCKILFALLHLENKQGILTEGKG